MKKIKVTAYINPEQAQILFAISKTAQIFDNENAFLSQLQRHLENTFPIEMKEMKINFKTLEPKMKDGEFNQEIKAFTKKIENLIDEANE